jgi:hypothetical protein
MMHARDIKDQLRPIIAQLIQLRHQGCSVDDPVLAARRDLLIGLLAEESFAWILWQRRGPDSSERGFLIEPPAADLPQRR